MWLRALEGDELTYRQAHDVTLRTQRALAEHGVAKGSRVLVTARTRPGYVLVWLALMRLGAVQVPTNPRNTVTELMGLVRQVEPALIVSDAELADTLRQQMRQARLPVSVADAATLDAGEGPDELAAVEPDDVAVMIPTSGTTGRSKLVMQTHRAYTMAGEGFPYWLGLTGEDRLMTSLPLFHINAPAYSVMGSVAARASVALIPRFSASHLLDQARALGATEINMIGAMLEMVMRQPQRADDADNPLRLCYTGPSPTRERQLEIEERFGLEIVCGYALSESPYGLIWPRPYRPFGTLGAARQHPRLGTVNEARAVSEDGEVVEPGEIGELQLTNPAVMLGYYDMAEETAAVLQDGWLKTGDLVRPNADGTFTFVARKKEIIRRRGENLSPVEVEDVLAAHPQVEQAAVIGIASELSEEEVKAFVVPADGTRVHVEALAAHAREHLTSFKVPRYVEIVRELPLTPTGRVAKHRLPRERTEHEFDLDDRAPSTSDPEQE